MASCSDTTCSANRVGRAPYSLLKMAPGAQALEKRALAHGEECLENLPVFRAEEEGIFFSATELRSIQPTHPKSNILIRWSRRNPCLTQFDCSNVADWQQRAAVRNEFVMNNTAGTGNEHVRPPVVADDVARNSGDEQRARLLKTMVLPPPTFKLGALPNRGDSPRDPGRREAQCGSGRAPTTPAKTVRRFFVGSVSQLPHRLAAWQRHAISATFPPIRYDTRHLLTSPTNGHAQPPSRACPGCCSAGSLFCGRHGDEAIAAAPAGRDPPARG